MLATLSSVASISLLAVLLPGLAPALLLLPSTAVVRAAIAGVTLISRSENGLGLVAFQDTTNQKDHSFEFCHSRHPPFNKNASAVNPTARV